MILCLHIQFVCHFRYILDHPDLFRGEKVLDVGSGCAASAIACKLVGVSRVTANDTDKGRPLIIGFR